MAESKQKKTVHFSSAKHLKCNSYWMNFQYAQYFKFLDDIKTKRDRKKGQNREKYKMQ